MIHLAVAQYQIEALPTWQAYEDKIVRMIELVKENDAHAILMSEYAGLELAGWTNGSLQKQFEVIQNLLPDYIELFTSLAKEYELYIQSGTIPVKETDGFHRNRAFLFSPDGSHAYQDKIFLTPFEKSTTLFQAGTELKVFETSIGKLGIVTCYDSEFPNLAHQLALQNVQLLLVPSCTERLSGLTRVSVASRARAIENQCYVAQSSLIGKASWCEFIDINIGQSAVYSPADVGFPENGILVQSEINTPMIIYADLNWDKLEHVRERGEMQNFKDVQDKRIDSLPISKVKM